MAVLPYVYKYFVKNTFCGRQAAVNYVLYVKFERKFGGIIMGSIGIIIVYVVVIGAMMYFLAIKPQKKEQKRTQELMDSMEIGDYVLTTSGFYGVLIDISDDDVIVEFGNNKNCRISMQKKAIAQVEKPSDRTSAE